MNMGITNDLLLLLFLLLLPVAVSGMLFLTKKLVLALWAFILILPFHSLLVTVLFVQVGLPVSVAKAISAWKEALLLAAVLVMLLRLPFRRLPLRLTVVDGIATTWICLILFYLVFQNVFLTEDISLSARLYGARDWLLFLLPYWIGRLVFVQQKNVSRIFKFILFVGIVTSLIGIFEYLFIPVEWHVRLGVPRYYAELLNLKYPAYLLGLPENYWVGTAGFGLIRRAVSTFLSSQGFAIPFLVIWPVVMYNHFGKRSMLPSRHTKSRLVMIMCFVALLLTITRMTIVACLLQSFLFLWFMGLLKKIVYIGLVLLLVFSIILVCVPPIREYLVLTITLRDSSGMTRPSQWIGGIRTLIEHPLGLGLGTTGQSGVRFGAGGAGQEAGYFMITGALGLPGLLLFIGWFFGIIGYSYRGYYKYKGDRRAIAMVVILTAVGILINNLTAPPNQSPFLVYTFSWLAGLSVQQTTLYSFLAKEDENTSTDHARVVRIRLGRRRPHNLELSKQ